MTTERQTITAIVIERATPFPPVYPAALIYVVDVLNPNDESEVCAAVAASRADDFGHADESDAIDKIAAGLELMFAFAGDLETVADYRA